MRNDRWSTNSEIKRALTSDQDMTRGGSVLYCKNGRHLKYTGEGHQIFLGVSGSGKSRRGTIPMVRSFIQAEESFIALDPKGEIYQQTGCYLGDNYDVRVIDFRHILTSQCVNLLAAPAELYRSGDPAKKQVAIEMVDDLAHTLYPVAGAKDPFWPQSAQSLFIGVVYALFEMAAMEQINMASVYQMIAKGQERFGASTYLKSFLELLPENSVAAMMLQSYVTTANDTAAGIRSTFLEGISMFARSEGLKSMMAYDDLHINQLDGETPTAIYLIVPDETPIFDSICTVLVGQLMGHYIRLAQDKYSGRLPRRVNFLVEEAGNVGTIGSLGHLMSAGRSRNVRVQLVLQNYSQLDTLYGSAEASTIRSNADVLVAYRTNHWETLSELSNKCGQRDVDLGGSLSRENLITPSQLGAMKTGQALVMVSGALRFISFLPDYTEIFDCSDWKAPVYEEKSLRREPETFDVGEFVKEEKQRKIREMMGEDSEERSSSVPSGFGGFRSSPFAEFMRSSRFSVTEDTHEEEDDDEDDDEPVTAEVISEEKASEDPRLDEITRRIQETIERLEREMKEDSEDDDQDEAEDSDDSEDSDSDETLTQLVVDEPREKVGEVRRIIRRYRPDMDLAYLELMVDEVSGVVLFDNRTKAEQCAAELRALGLEVDLS